MEVPAPDSGEAAATGKQGAGVGRVPVSPGRGRARGLGAGEDAESSLAPGGGSRAAGTVGEGRGGRAAEGGGAARCPQAERPSGSRVWPGCSPSVVGLPCLPPPPTKVKPETSRRGWLSPPKRPLCGPRRAPSVEGLEIGGEGGVALASARFPPSCPRPVMSARDPTEHPGALGVRGPGWRWRAETALTRRELTVQWGGRR